MTTASLAAIPSRAAVLPQVIDSLLPQVDQVRVWLNGWDHTPKCVMQPGVVVMGRADKGDAGKFGGVQEGYCFTCDDDLVYAPSYVAHLTGAIDRYQRKAVISLHGRTFISHPIKSYYNDPALKIRCLQAEERDMPVEIAGTGVMAWHSDTVTFTLDDFPVPNMADIWASIKLERLGIPRIAVAHPEGMVRHLPIDMTTTIHHRYKKNDRVQTEAVNSIQWDQRRAA